MGPVETPGADGWVGAPACDYSQSLGLEPRELSSHCLLFAHPYTLFVELEGANTRLPGIYDGTLQSVWILDHAKQWVLARCVKPDAYDASERDAPDRSPYASYSQ